MEKIKMFDLKCSEPPFELTIEDNMNLLMLYVAGAVQPTPVLFPEIKITKNGPVFIRFTWTGTERLSFVGFNSASPLESLTPIGGHPGEWQYLAVIAPGASAADVIAEIELIAGVGPVKI